MKAAPAPAAPVPLLAPWLAFVAAGVCALVAGELAASVPTYAATFVELGVELPWVTQQVVDGGRAVPVLLVGAALALLALGGAPVERRRWTPRATEAARLAAGGAVLGSGALFAATLLVYGFAHRTCCMAQ